MMTLYKRPPQVSFGSFSFLPSFCRESPRYNLANEVNDGAAPSCPNFATAVRVRVFLLSPSSLGNRKRHGYVLGNRGHWFHVLFGGSGQQKGPHKQYAHGWPLPSVSVTNKSLAFLRVSQWPSSWTSNRVGE